jgi:hypothetical protein
MPIYEYACTNEGCVEHDIVFELEILLVEYTSEVPCGVCSGIATRRFTKAPELHRSNDPQARADMLKKRSQDDAKKHVHEYHDRFTASVSERNVGGVATEKFQKAHFDKKLKK